MNKSEDFPCGCKGYVILCPEASRLWRQFMDIYFINERVPEPGENPDYDALWAVYRAHFDNQTPL